MHDPAGLQEAGGVVRQAEKDERLSAIALATEGRTNKK